MRGRGRPYVHDRCAECRFGPSVRLLGPFADALLSLSGWNRSSSPERPSD